MDEKEALEMKASLESKGETEFFVCTLEKNVTIKKSMVTISKDIKKEHQRVFSFHTFCDQAIFWHWEDNILPL